MEAEGTGPIAKELAGVDAADLVGGMLEAAPVGMLIAGPDSAVPAANRLAGEVFAVDPGALSGVPIAELLGDVAFETGGAGEILDAGEPAAPAPADRDGRRPRAGTMELLREFGVDYCQGFEVGPPAAAPDLVPPPHPAGA